MSDVFRCDRMDKGKENEAIEKMGLTGCGNGLSRNAPREAVSPKTTDVRQRSHLLATFRYSLNLGGKLK
ncbi:hypothetical protein [Paraburkholderia sp. SIMBA_053]|uniref:hypothetical protein n=1 Tax=Paraburkholderia sp. SIMBA_053 TaxID=3085794 RepID=UPI00397B34C0